MPSDYGGETAYEQEVNTLFQNETIDQLWVTLDKKKKEGEAMQVQLRQLVGDRYQDLLSASDMIVGMGDICDYLIESFEDAKAERMKAAGHEEPKTAAEPFNTTTHAYDVRETALFMTDVLHQIQAWLREGRYLEAALARRKLQEAVEYLEGWCRRVGNPDKKGYLERQVDRALKHIAALPEDIVTHASAAMLDTDIAALQDPSTMISTCSQIVCCISLIDDVALQPALQCFIERQRTRLINLCGVRAGPDTAIASICTLYTVHSFLYKVFVEGGVGLTESLELTAVATLHSSMASSKAVMDLARYVSTDAYYPPTALDLVPQDLPPAATVKTILDQWQANTAPVVLSVLRTSLEQLTEVGEVVAVKARLDKVTGLWDNEPVHAQPPTAWGESITEEFRKCLMALLHSELAGFVNKTQLELAAFAEWEGGEAIPDTSEVTDQEIALRYTCGGKAVVQGAAKGKVDEMVACFEKLFQRVVEVAEVVMDNVGRAGVQNVVKAVTVALQNVADCGEKTAAARPVPTTGQALQGITRTVASIFAASTTAATHLPPSLISPFSTTLHKAYLTTFESWASRVAEQFISDVRVGITETYWGPDKQIFEKIQYCMWEHRETQAEGDTIISNLPGYATPAVLLALERCCAEVAKVGPSVLRRDVVTMLHGKMGEVFREYLQLVEGGKVCQEGLWQVMFDVRFIAEVCEGCKGEGYQAVVKALLDSETGIDPVYWSTEQRLFEQIFTASIDAVRLLYSAHTLSPPIDTKPPKATSFDSFISECDRFPTLHLAPLQSTTATPSADIAYTTSQASSRSDATASQSPLATLQGLQHLHALGTGIQQQWKGMKYFSWS